MKADAILAITQPEDYLDGGFYDVEVAKTRFGNNKHEHKTIVVNIDKQRITDIDNYQSENATASLQDVNFSTASNALTTAANIII